MNKLIFSVLVSLTVFTGTALANESLPTIQQVFQAAHSGHMDEAQKMMAQVLETQPNSAKAHFVEAQLLAEQHRNIQAGEELKKAETLEPGLPFAKPQAVQKLKAQIAGAHGVASRFLSSQTHSSGMPWTIIALVIGAIALIVLAVRTLSPPRNRYAGTTYPTNTTSPTQGTPYGAYPPATPSSSMGSNIMSGLATGVGVGAGIAAGEALAHHFLDGERSNTGDYMPTATPVDSDPSSQYDMGGNDFGLADDSSWSDGSGMDSFTDSGGDDWS